jgi:hypothetical protein
MVRIRTQNPYQLEVQVCLVLVFGRTQLSRRKIVVLTGGSAATLVLLHPVVISCCFFCRFAGRPFHCCLNKPCASDGECFRSSVKSRSVFENVSVRLSDSYPTSSSQADHLDGHDESSNSRGAYVAHRRSHRTLSCSSSTDLPQRESLGLSFVVPSSWIRRSEFQRFFFPT